MNSGVIPASAPISWSSATTTALYAHLTSDTTQVSIQTLNALMGGVGGEPQP